MTAVVSLTMNDVITACGTFLRAILPVGTEIVRAQGNGVPMPKGPFVAMTPGTQRRLSTNRMAWTSGAPGAKAVTVPTEFTVQLDFYGPQASAWASMAMALLRDDFGCEAMPAGIVPLHADDPVQIPLVTGEQTWLERWKVSAAFQANPVVTVQQESAIALHIETAEVDITFPP